MLVPYFEGEETEDAGIILIFKGFFFYYSCQEKVLQNYNNVELESYILK